MAVSQELSRTAETSGSAGNKGRSLLPFVVRSLYGGTLPQIGRVAGGGGARRLCRPRVSGDRIRDIEARSAGRRFIIIRDVETSRTRTK
jgi:hypothetical protein